MLETNGTSEPKHAHWMVKLVVVAGLMASGITAIVAALAVILSPLIFDNPAAIRSPLTWNVAVAPIAYLLAFIVSLRWVAKAIATGERRALGRWLYAQFLGIGWVALAYALLQVVCKGNFGCR